MKQEELKKQIKEKIDSLDDRIYQLKSQAVNVSRMDTYKQHIKGLEETRDLIRKKYEEMESSGKEEWTRLDKNIYADLESFNTAFKEAGALFKPRQK
jgi:hypothetical protein